MKDRLLPALLVTLLVVSAVLASAALLRGGTLESGAPSSSGPLTGLTSAAATYDASDGYDVWLLPDGSTWTYAHGSWADITSTAGIPSGMENNVRMTFDARDGYVLLFGGTTSSLLARPLAETWKFEAGHWTNLTSSVVGAPPPRALGVMTYDSEDKVVVLFGGAPSGGVSGNQTWTYAGGVWTNATVPGPPPIGGAYDNLPLYGFVDDPSDGYVLYYNPFAGCGPTCSILWTYRGGVWTNETATMASVPWLGLFVLFAYDSTSSEVVVQAMCRTTSSFPCAHSYGTFVFSHGEWKDVTPSSEPSGRDFSSWVDDPSDGGVMMIGGCCWADFSGLSLPWQDVWVYSHGTWTESEPWGGGAPSWEQNDGVWIGFSLLSISVVVAVFSLRSRTPP